MAKETKTKRLVISALDHNPKSVKIDKHIYDARPMTNRELEHLKDGLTPETFDYFIENILKPRQANKAEDIRKATLNVPFNQWHSIIQIFITPEDIANDESKKYLKEFKADKSYSIVGEIINAKNKKIEIRGIPLTIGEFLDISDTTIDALPEIDENNKEAFIEAITKLNIAKREAIKRVNDAFNRIIELRRVGKNKIDISEFLKDMPAIGVKKLQEFLVDPNQNVGNEDKDGKN